MLTPPATPEAASRRRGLLATSVFIARESGRQLDTEAFPHRSPSPSSRWPSCMPGVLAAQDTRRRARRLASLEAVSDLEVLSIDERVAAEWAALRVHLAERGRRININDLWIAATAVAHRLPVVTQDGDFDPPDGVDGLVVIRV